MWNWQGLNSDPQWFHTVMTAEHSHTAVVAFWDAYSGPYNFIGYKPAYITTHEHVDKHLGVVWGVANCKISLKKLLSCTQSQRFRAIFFSCEISIKQNIGGYVLMPVVQVQFISCTWNEMIIFLWSQWTDKWKALRFEFGLQNSCFSATV